MRTKTKKASELQPGDILSLDPARIVGEVGPMEGGVWYSVKGGNDGEGPDFNEADDDTPVTVIVEEKP